MRPCISFAFHSPSLLFPLESVHTPNRDGSVIWCWGTLVLEQSTFTHTYPILQRHHSKMFPCRLCHHFSWQLHYHMWLPLCLVLPHKSSCHLLWSESFRLNYEKFNENCDNYHLEPVCLHFAIDGKKVQGIQTHISCSAHSLNLSMPCTSLYKHPALRFSSSLSTHPRKLLGASALEIPSWR